MGDRAGSGVLQDCVLRSTDASAFGRGAAGQRDGRWCSGAVGVTLCDCAVIGHWLDIRMWTGGQNHPPTTVWVCSGVNPRGSVTNCYGLLISAFGHKRPKSAGFIYLYSLQQKRYWLWNKAKSVLYSILTWQHAANCVRAEKGAAGDAECLQPWNGTKLESTEFISILQMKASQQSISCWLTSLKNTPVLKDLWFIFYLYHRHPLIWVWITGELIRGLIQLGSVCLGVHIRGQLPLSTLLPIRALHHNQVLVHGGGI